MKLKQGDNQKVELQLCLCMANQRKELFALMLILLPCKELTQAADSLGIYLLNMEIKEKQKPP